MTDISSGWTGTRSVKSKAHKWVFETIKQVRKDLPFELLGIDSDSGGEFINHAVYNYCVEEKITLTRGRSYRKNDNCYVYKSKSYKILSLESLSVDVKYEFNSDNQRLYSGNDGAVILAEGKIKED